jgi:hypothetical protein
MRTERRAASCRVRQELGRVHYKPSATVAALNGAGPETPHRYDAEYRREAG